MTLSIKTPQQRFDESPTFEAYLGAVQKNRELWQGVYRRLSLSDEIRQRLATITSPRKLLALSEDWCGDAVNILPWVSRLAEASDHVDFRILGRDENPDLMDAHLTDGSRSIPIVIVFDEDFRELGWWGPRPQELQAWVRANLDLDSAERYKHVRRFYAQDKGRSILSELLDVMTM